MAAVRFSKPEVVYLGHGLRYFGLEIDFRFIRQVSLKEIWKTDVK